MTNICIIGFPAGEEREKRAERLFKKVLAENFPNIGEETYIQIQEAHKIPNKMKPKRPHTNTHYD